MPGSAALTRRDSVELIRIGTWDISTGQWEVSREDLASAIAAMECPAVRRAHLKLGHRDLRFKEVLTEDGEPAIGWIENMRLADRGTTLVGDYTGIPGWLNEVMASAYPDRSVEGTYNMRCQLGHTHPFVLTAVALLGVTPPGIGTLKPIGSIDDIAALYGIAAGARAADEVRVAASISARDVDAKFDVNQKRDRDGEWTKGGGPGAAGGRTVSVSFAGMSPATPVSRAAVREKTGKAIPPAWTDVHIADDLDNASLIVRGRDAKGRPQSRYSAAHTEAQAAKKFQRVRELNRHLDKLDFSLERDADTDDDAGALLLIRKLGMRPGSDRNTGADKQAHGATNLLAKHVRVADGRAEFDFTGKDGVHIQLSSDDPAVVSALSQRLEARSGDDRLFNTNETKTRAYMRSAGVPDDFLLKDLRTVRANVVALREIAARKGTPKTKAEFRRWRMDVAKTVSGQLGNTPTLALSSYINPTVFARWQGGEDWA